MQGRDPQKMISDITEKKENSLISYYQLIYNQKVYEGKTKVSMINSIFSIKSNQLIKNTSFHIHLIYPVEVKVLTSYNT